MLSRRAGLAAIWIDGKRRLARQVRSQDHFIPTWNFTGSRHSFAQNDVLIFSVAKSGRTWLRVMLRKYYAELLGIEFSLDRNEFREAGLPSIHFDHELWTHLQANLWKRALGYRICPLRVLRTKRVVFLYRDPRDTVVSEYFANTRRTKRFAASTTLAEFIRLERYGLPAIIRVMNHWRRQSGRLADCHWLGYESLARDPEPNLSLLLDFIGVEARPRAIAAAVEFSRFENMQKMEMVDGFDSAILRPADMNDPDSFKVRRGKIGGFADYMDRDMLDYANAELLKLDPWFGYKPTA
jgi:hypothetical protein